jgi:hypothetical protein
MYGIRIRDKPTALAGDSISEKKRWQRRGSLVSVLYLVVRRNLAGLNKRTETLE